MTGRSPSPSVPPAPGRLPDPAYLRMALVLRVGLALSLTVFLAALIAYLAIHPGAAWESSAPVTWRPFLSAAGFLRGLEAGSPVAFLTLGILLLVATPIFRVLPGLYYFRRGGERTMTAITLTVLLLLLFGLFVLGPLIR
ncbi:MAG: DUF1634 domain-containing protein [Thermoplasmata archaeon]